MDLKSTVNASSNEKFNEHFGIIENLTKNKDKDRSLRILLCILSQTLMKVSEADRDTYMHQIKWLTHVNC